MLRSLSCHLALGLSLFLGRSALADEAPASDPPPAEQAAKPVPAAVATWPINVSQRPLTLARGMLEVGGELFLGHTDAGWAEPFAFSPSLRYGVSDSLTVGISHGELSSYPYNGMGVCLSGTSHGCPDVYGSVTADALYSVFKMDVYEVAVRGGLQALSFDPVLVRANVSARLRYSGAAFGAFVAEPRLSFGLSHRDPVFSPPVPSPVATDPGNKEFFSLPVTAYENAGGDAVSFFEKISLSGPVSGWSDFNTLLFGGGIVFTPIALGLRQMDVTLEGGALYLDGKGYEHSENRLPLYFMLRADYRL
jgi:hypothetical protein